MARQDRSSHGVVCTVENAEAEIGPYWLRGGVQEAARKLYNMGHRQTDGWTYRQKKSMRELVSAMGFDVSEMSNVDLVETLNSNTMGELI